MQGNGSPQDACLGGGNPPICGGRTRCAGNLTRHTKAERHLPILFCYVVDVARKLVNSPACVRLCVVRVAHKLSAADIWVFWDGRGHLDYRRGLNSLFTTLATC